MTSRSPLRIALLLVLLSAAFPCVAQPEKGYWTAASSTANSITGDVAIFNDRVTINLYPFAAVKVRALAPAEVSATFDADINSGNTGTLYHLVVPATKRFLHHNTLCGTEDTQWMATYVSGRSLQVAFFSGSNPPTLTFDAVRSSTDLCGSFTYTR